MTKLSRRHLVAGGLAGAGASVFPGFIREANAATSIRYNLASANGQVMLKKYAQAVKLMMALPPPPQPLLPRAHVFTFALFSPAGVPLPPWTPPPSPPRTPGTPHLPLLPQTRLEETM